MEGAVTASREPNCVRSQSSKQRLLYFVLGFLFAPCLLLALLLVGLKFGWIGVDARTKVSKTEAELAPWARNLGIEKQISGLSCPLPASEENLIEGAEHYREYCSQCHGGSDVPSALAGAVFYPPPPDLEGLARVTQARTFWYAKRGIRVTGMPSFEDILSDEALWQISLFLQHHKENPRAHAALLAPVKQPAIVEYVVDQQSTTTSLKESKP